jgi:hypothetical protein
MRSFPLKSMVLVSILILAACAPQEKPLGFSAAGNLPIGQKFSVGQVTITGMDLKSEVQNPSDDEREFSEEVRQSVSDKLTKVGLIANPGDSQSDQLNFSICYSGGGIIRNFVCNPASNGLPPAFLISPKDYGVATSAWNGGHLVGTLDASYGTLPSLSDKKGLADQFAGRLVDSLQLLTKH